MANTLRRGNTLRVFVKNLSAAVSAGSLTRDNGQIGVPLNHGAVGETCAFVVNGVIAVTNDMQHTVVAGSNIYWDTSAGGISIGAGNDDYFIGKAETGAAQNSAFDLLFDPNNKPYGQEQS